MIIQHNITCKNCQAKANYVCTNCYQEYSCIDHQDLACGPSALIQESILENNLNTMHQKLQVSNKKNTKRFYRVLKKYSECINYLKNIFDAYTKIFESTKSRINQMNLEISGLKTQSSEACKDTISFIYGVDVLNGAERELKKIENIYNNFLYACANDPRKETEKTLNDSLEFRDLAPDCARQLDCIKATNSIKPIDIISDMILEIEDNKNKILKQNLKLTDKMFSADIAPELFTSLHKICPNIQKITARLNQSNLNTICNTLTLYPNLIFLEIETRIEDSSFVPALFKIISTIPTLKHLSLKNIFIQDSGIPVIEFIPAKLKLLDLKSNNISSGNCDNLFCTLSNWKSIKYLTISNNKLLNNAMEKFIIMIDKLNDLEYLNLSENDIEFDSFINLIQKISSKNTIRELQIYGNKINVMNWKKISNLLNWSQLYRVVIDFGVDSETIRILKSFNKKIFFKNKNFCVEEASNKSF